MENKHSKQCMRCNYMRRQRNPTLNFPVKTSHGMKSEQRYNDEEFLDIRPDNEPKSHEMNKAGTIDREETDN